jgi:hypothetical protein
MAMKGVGAAVLRAAMIMSLSACGGADAKRAMAAAAATSYALAQASPVSVAWELFAAVDGGDY